MVPRYPDFFNDVFGPIMQPGSSSHQAGPCRLSLLAASLLGEPPRTAEFTLDPAGSFAGTFGQMNEDVALIAGALGIGPADPAFFDARKVAAAREMTVRFSFGPITECGHPNAVRIALSGATRTVVTVGASVGGGMVRVFSVQGFAVDLEGESFVTFAFDDEPFTPSESFDGGVSRLGQKTMRWFATRDRPDNPPGSVLVMESVLPVPANPARERQLFDTMTEWRRIADASGRRFSDVAIEYEMRYSGWSERRVVAEMRTIHSLLRDEVYAAYSARACPSPDSFSRRDDAVIATYLAEDARLSGAVHALALKLALGVNAKTRGVPIVPGPMGTGGGYLFSALRAAQIERGLSNDAILRGLFVAAGVGAIAYSRTAPTGEIIGCAGECGVCSAMTAAALVECLDGTALQAEHAASFAMQAAIGMPCDPIPGGFEQPCLSRIVAAVGNAITFAELALAGSDAVLPFHEALDAADSVGRALPSELKCTSRGGCCSTPTGARLAKEFHEQVRHGHPDQNAE